jgi:hypothetical protein
MPQGYKNTGEKLGFKKGHKTSIEIRKKISESVKKNPSRFWLGKKRPSFSDECRSKMSKSHKGMKHTQEELLKMSMSQVGFKNHQWKGGITKLYRRVRNSKFYRKWRNGILKINGRICMFCKTTDGLIDVDHYPITYSSIIKKFKLENPEMNNDDLYIKIISSPDMWDVNNCRVLCRNCHKKTESYGYKKNN